MRTIEWLMGGIILVLIWYGMELRYVYRRLDWLFVELVAHEWNARKALQAIRKEIGMAEEIDEVQEATAEKFVENLVGGIYSVEGVLLEAYKQRIAKQRL